MFYLTAPCVPHHIETYIECEDSLGSVSWTESDGAEFYTAIAVGLDGHIHTCVSNSSTCSWDDLHCGDSYVVQVNANWETCTSQPSNSTTIHMGEYKMERERKREREVERWKE